MEKLRIIFHYCSFIQYPFILIALYFSYEPLITEVDNIWESYNKALVFFGLGISFSTLQDTKKVHYKFVKKIYGNARRSKLFLIYLIALIFFFLTFGFYGLFFADIQGFQDTAFGMIVLGIGLIGLLKTASEMIAHHQKEQKEEGETLSVEVS